MHWEFALKKQMLIYWLKTLKITESSECYIYTSKLDFMRLIHDLAKLGQDGGGMESGCVASWMKIEKLLSKMLIVNGSQTRTFLRKLALNSTGNRTQDLSL